MDLSEGRALDERALWLLGGMTVAVWLGGWWMERSFRTEGGAGTMSEAVQVADRKARDWSPQPLLLGVEGRDLVKGRAEGRGGWIVTYADARKLDRVCEVHLGKHFLKLWPERGKPGPVLPMEGLMDSVGMAELLPGKGVPPQAPATWSWRVDGARPLLQVATAGRFAATWSLDPVSGQLLAYDR